MSWGFFHTLVVCWHCAPICSFLHSVSIQWNTFRCVAALSCASALWLIEIQLNDVPAAVHLLIWDTTGTFPLQLSPTQKVFYFPTDEHECKCWIWTGKERRAVTACHWVLMCAARVTSYSLSFPVSCVLCCFDLTFPRSLSLRSSLSVFLSFSPPQSRGSCAPWQLSFSFSLTVFTLLFPFSFFSLSFTLANRTSNSLNISHNPTPSLSLSLSPMRLNGSQRPVQMHVISNSILSDSEAGLIFVAALWYHIHFLHGSSSFSLAFFQSDSRWWLCSCVSLFHSLSLQLLVVSSIVYW